MDAPIEEHEEIMEIFLCGIPTSHETLMRSLCLKYGVMIVHYSGESPHHVNEFQSFMYGSQSVIGNVKEYIKKKEFHFNRYDNPDPASTTLVGHRGEMGAYAEIELSEFPEELRKALHEAIMVP